MESGRQLVVKFRAVPPPPGMMGLLLAVVARKPERKVYAEARLVLREELERQQESNTDVIGDGKGATWTREHVRPGAAAGEPDCGDLQLFAGRLGSDGPSIV
jgi:hypothetical protein